MEKFSLLALNPNIVVPSTSSVRLGYVFCLSVKSRIFHVVFNSNKTPYLVKWKMKLVTHREMRQNRLLTHLTLQQHNLHRIHLLLQYQAYQLLYSSLVARPRFYLITIINKVVNSFCPVSCCYRFISCCFLRVSLCFQLQPPVTGGIKPCENYPPHMYLREILITKNIIRSQYVEGEKLILAYTTSRSIRIP
jgi:hypothetical protein